MRLAYLIVFNVLDPTGRAVAQQTVRLLVGIETKLPPPLRRPAIR
jgi:hypothetical protein